VTDAIIIDLDGTLCNTDHRQHFMQQKKKDWKSFYAGLNADPIHEWCHKIVNFFWGSHKVIFLSGRPGEYRKNTESWLDLYRVKYNYLYMREIGDYRKDCIIKREIYLKKIKPNYNILFCIDDRKQVVDMWREEGLTCLQCAPGEF